MAYGITNKAKFKDDNGIYYEVHILKNGYTGSSSEFNVGGDGFKLSWKRRGANIDSPIHSSEITFDFILRDNDDRNRILDMYQRKEGDYIARIYMNNSGTESNFEAITPIGRFWTGVIILNESILEDVDYPQPFRIRAIDGLELLKSKKFNEITNIYNERSGETDAAIKTADSNGDFEGGYYTFQSLILGILNLIPISEVFLDNPAVDSYYQFFGSWWSSLTNITEADAYYDPTNIIFCQSNAFYTKPSTPGATIKYVTCYDALEQILFFMNARIHQEEGTFKIIQLSVYDKWQDDAIANYAFYAKGGSGLAGTTNLNKSLTSQSNKRSLTKFNFKRILKRLIYNIAGASESTPLNVSSVGGGIGIINQINLPGTSLSSAWHTFTEYTLPTASTPPGANYYKNTYLQVESGQNMTFVFNYSVKHIAAAPPTASEWGEYNEFAYRSFIIVKINGATDYYLKFDTDQEKYIWNTTEGPVFTAPNLAIQGLFGYPLFSTDSVGAMSTDEMEAIPINGELEYYVYSRYYGVYAYAIDGDGNYVPNILIDETTALSVDVVSTAHPDQSPGNYNVLDFPVASCQLYLDGAAPSFVGYQYENLDGGTVVDNGEEITQSINFIEQYATQGDTDNNTIYVKDSNTYQANNFNRGLTPTWTLRYDTTGMDAVHLPDLKGMINLGLLSKFRFIMDTRLVRETDVLNLDPYEFAYLLVDTVEGSTRYFICAGGEYTATPAYFRGEWIEVDFDNINKTGDTHTGTFINASHQSFTSSNVSMLPNNTLPKTKT